MKWDMVKLGDVCEIINGFAFKSANYVEKGIRIIRITNVQKGYIEDPSPQFYPISEYENIKKYELYENDLLISLTGNVGRVALLTKKLLPAALNQRVCCIRIKTNVSLHKNFLFSCLCSDTFEHLCINSAQGVAQKNMSTEWLKKYNIPLPPLEEQKRIAAILDKAHAIRQKRQQNLENADALIKSVFLDMFGDPVTNPKGWEKISLQEAMTTLPQNGLYKPQSAYVSDNEGTPILRIDGFYDGKLVQNKPLKRLTCSEKDTEKYALKENDIVINRVNSIEYLGKCALITNLNEDTVFESNMMRFHMDETIFNPIYIVKLLCSQYIYIQILNCSKKAVNQASINQNDVQNFTVYTPPIILQNKFADIVQKVEAQKAKQQEHLHEADQAFRALQQQFFG